MWRSFTEDVTMFKWGPSHSIMEVVHIWDVDVDRTPAPIYWDFVTTSIQFIEFLWGHSSGGLRRAVSGPISGRLGQSHLIGSLLYPPALLSQCELCKWNVIIPRKPLNLEIPPWVLRFLLHLVSQKNSPVLKYRGCQSFIGQSLCTRKWHDCKTYFPSSSSFSSCMTF